MKRKLFPLLLVLALVLTMLPPALAIGGSGQTFSDVAPGHWAFSSIEELVERKAINGYPDGNFYPERTVSREEFAKIMVVAAGLAATPAESSTYADVPLNYWASAYIETARPYMTAYQNQGQLYFYPTAGALREDIAVAVVKLKGLDTRMADLSILSTMFSDIASISKAARPYVALAVEHGIITGYTDGTFRGQGTITRAEAAAMLWRAFQQGSGSKVIPDDVLPSPTAEATPTPTAAPVPTATPAPTPTPSAAPEPTQAPIPEVRADNYSLIYGKDGDRIGVLSMDGTRRIISVAPETALTAPNGYQVGDLVVYEDRDNKALLAVVGERTTAGYDSGTKTFGGMAIAEDCVLFAECSAAATGAGGASYKAYRLWDMASIPSQSAVCVTDGENRVAAVYMDLAAKPKPSEVQMVRTDPVYGVVSAAGGRAEIGGVLYYSYSVHSNGEEYEINVSGDVLKKGQLVSLKPSNDNCYFPDDITVYTEQNAVAGCCDAYNESSRLLTLFSDVTWKENGVYVASQKPNSYMVSKDCAIVYVNMARKQGGDEIGVNSYDVTTGYKNIMIVLDETDTVIAIFVETSGECDIVP